MMPDYSKARSFLMCAVLVLMVGCAGPAVKAPPAVDPQQVRALAEQGRHAHEQGQRQAAKTAWRQAVALDPGASVVVNNLALLLVEDRDFAEAVSLLELGLAHSPDTSELHYNLAVISELYLLDLEKALAHYQRYRALSETDDATVSGWIADLERRLD